MVEVSEKQTRVNDTAAPRLFTPDLYAGKPPAGAHASAQEIVNAQFGAPTITPEYRKVSAEVVPVTQSGCGELQGHHAEVAYDHLKAEGTDALNKPATPGTGPADQSESDVANRIAKDTSAFANPNLDAAESEDRLIDIQKSLEHLDKDQTRRVLDEVNKQLAQYGYKYAETQDGAVWLGASKDGGKHYDATSYVRAPECSVG